MEAEYSGLIISSRGGFYEVRTEAGFFACRARGLFRKEGVSPLVGDQVRIRATAEKEGYVEEIFPRRNSLIRPPVANIDYLVMVLSAVSPPPNLLVADKLITAAVHKGIAPVVAVTKADLSENGEAERFRALYDQAGFPAFLVCAVTREGVPELLRFLSGKISCFCGNTGAGKSSLLNAIDPRLGLPTGEISEKLGRGRHTTRHAQLYELETGGYIADTPGFSAMDLSRYEVILKEELPDCFPEFAPYLGKCRFTGCSHTREAGCAVLEAAADGKISESRLQSYQAMMEDAKQYKEWEHRPAGRPV